MSRLERISEGVFGARTEVNIGLGARLPLRMTVVRDHAGLVLYSPIEIDDGLAAELAQHGEVHSLVGPNLLHHGWLEAAQARYPQARLLGAPGLASKRSDLSFDGELSTGELSPEIGTLRVEGAEKLSEVVLLHRPSRTLVVADAIFNIPQARGMTRFILRYLSGTLGRFEQSRLIRTLTDDREATARSVAALLALDFERVVPAHGEVLEEDAARRLRDGLWWWRGERRRPDAA